MNKFIPWIDQDYINNTQGYADFSSDAQRSQGFQSGTPASSIRVNTALRQANLVAAALMNVVAPDNQNIDYRSDINTIITAITSGLKSVKVTNAANADKALNSDNATTWSNYSIWVGSAAAYEAIVTKDVNTLYFIKES